MANAPDASAKLWGVIVSYGLEQEFERDLLGRIKYRRTNAYISAKASPELLQLLTNANSTLSAAKSGAAGAMNAARDTLRQRLLGKAAEITVQTSET